MPKPEFVLVPREPTEEQLDDLCRAMWGHKWHWDDSHDQDPEHRQSQEERRKHRTLMRAFLKAAPPSPSVDEEMLEALKECARVLHRCAVRFQGKDMQGEREAENTELQARAAITRATGGKE